MMSGSLSGKVCVITGTAGAWGARTPSHSLTRFGDRRLGHTPMVRVRDSGRIGATKA